MSENDRTGHIIAREIQYPEHENLDISESRALTALHTLHWDGCTVDCSGTALERSSVHLVQTDREHVWTIIIGTP